MGIWKVYNKKIELNFEIPCFNIVSSGIWPILDQLGYLEDLVIQKFTPHLVGQLIWVRGWI